MVAKVFTTPFAANGDKLAIPNPAQPGGEVSYDAGFGPDYERQLGIDPLAKNISRENFNAAINDITVALQEFQSGAGTPVYNATLAAALPGAGYAKGAVVPRSDNNGYWISTAVNNADDPEVTFGKWAPLDVQGSFVQALTNVNVTLSLLNAGFPQIVLTGALTGNVQVIVPAWAYSYRIVNNCTGLFTVTVKTAGTGVIVLNSLTTMVTVSSTGVTVAETVIRKIVVQTFAASGTYTPTAGMQYIKVRQVAGGGGGAGCTGGAGSSAGGGGQSGGYSEKMLTAAQVGASQAVTIGSAGLPGNAAANGGNGGNTSLGALLISTGGAGGTAGVSGAVIALSGSGGSALGSATGGDVNINGEAGGVGFIMGSTNGGLSGFGAGNPFSARAPQSGPVGSGVTNSTGRGGGGSGGACTSVSQVGGGGGGGFMEITEYCS